MIGTVGEEGISAVELGNTSSGYSYGLLVVMVGI